MKKIINWYNKYIASVNFIQCAALAYYSILALIPGLYIFFYVLKLLYIPTDKVQLFLIEILPLKSVEQLIDFAIKHSNASLFSALFVIISSLIIISQGVYVFIKYINNEFCFKQSPKIHLRIRAFIISLFLITMLAFLLILLMIILPILTNNLPRFLFHFLLFLCYVVIHFIIVFLLYKVSLNKDIAFRYIWKGLLFFSIMASLLYLLFSPFIKVFANNYASYGPLAGFASLLIFFYVYFVLLLISINISFIQHQKMIK